MLLILNGISLLLLLFDSSLCLPQICGTNRQHGSSMLSNLLQNSTLSNSLQITTLYCPIFGKIRHPSNIRKNSSSSLSKSTIKYHTPQIVPSFTTPQLLKIAYIFLLFLRVNLPQKGCSRLAHEKV